MIDIVNNELDYIDMSINVTKSLCLRIRERFNSPTTDILIGDKPIVVSQEFKYLALYNVPAELDHLRVTCIKLRCNVM